MTVAREVALEGFGAEMTPIEFRRFWADAHGHRDVDEAALYFVVCRRIEWRYPADFEFAAPVDAFATVEQRAEGGSDRTPTAAPSAHPPTNQHRAARGGS